MLKIKKKSFSCQPIILTKETLKTSRSYVKTQGGHQEILKHYFHIDLLCFFV